ncbi:hypothetical protein ACFWMP_11750 [Paenibacillus sp. NPDC058367]|uniref:hypothetical protein n=1 Tax=unclassified Paenibacillus TaxID=185978 RepID=UPI0004F62CE6|nr:hypothetical protein [Paenibacillus sp. FSL H7-0737]AIQ24785.1 hypothetical protein H70737_19155 [Paenibacillus sp. FSL H7-0737]
MDLDDVNLSNLIRLSHGKTPEITKHLIDGEIDCTFVHMPLHDPLRQKESYPLRLSNSFK